MRRGTRIANAYVAVAVDGDHMNEGIVEGFDKAGPEVEKAGDEQGKTYGDHFSEGFLSRMRERFRNRGEDGALGFGSKNGSKAGDDFGSAMVARLKARIATAEGLAEKFGRDFDKALDNPKSSFTKLDNLSRKLASAEGFAKRLTSELDKVSGNRKGVGFGLTSLDDWLRNARPRNNALNILYKSLGGLIGLFESGFLVVKNFGEGIKAVGQDASFVEKLMGGLFGGAGGEGVSASSGALGGIGKGLAGIVSSAPGAVFAFLAIAAGASVLVSVLGGLVAIVTALVATIASALVGALAIGGAGMLAMVAAGGLLVAAFTSMTDAQSKFFKQQGWLPLKEEFTGIGQVLLHDLLPATTTWAHNLQQALGLALPVASVMGKAFGEAGNIFTRALSGPGFIRFSQMLTVYLPSITTRLSTALGGFLNGLLGTFSALLPYVNQFAGWLAAIALRFSAWANSAQGQNAIERFMERAVVAIKATWNLLTSFTSFLFSVLFNPSAQNAGNTMFDSMARSFRKFADAIARAQADGSLNQWFKDGVKFGASLWQVVEALYNTFIALYNSGVLNATGQVLGGLAKVMNIVAAATGPLIDSFGKYLPGSMTGLVGLVGQLGGALDWVARKIGLVSDQIIGTVIGTQQQIDQFNHTLLGPLSPAPKSSSGPKLPKFDINALIASGTNALNHTSVKNGGFVPKPTKTKPKYHNPYVAFANSLIDQGPSTSASIRNAMLSLNKSAADGIRSAAKASGSDSVTSSMDSLFESLTTGGTQVVNTAQQALNSAATSLANATTKGAAKAALKKVKQSQKDLKAALADQGKLNALATMLSNQKVTNEANITALTRGIAVQNATLADYAEARARVATMMQDANQQLTAAVQLRDSYNTQVADSIRSFAGLVTAQAQVLDGVTQSLSAGDITSNLQAKLDQIKHFQEDLRLLLAQGLSNDAYKQIVDAGVEQGTQFADALLSGGNSAIQNTNNLVDQINNIAGTLGTDTSNRLYQAGVDAAQGLVDGLTSLSAQLDSAAYALGTSIANAVKSALGIASPSRVLRNMMAYVGDGMALGLGDQTAKVGTAASALAAQVAISPTAPAAAAAAAAAVSGNGKPSAQVDLTIVTPTEDPHAVANEVINEVVGRLT